jgi:hypothetical protein
VMRLGEERACCTETLGTEFEDRVFGLFDVPSLTELCTAVRYGNEK